MTGLNTCSPTKRSGRPLACASRSTDSEEVVLARIASGPRIASSSASSRALTSWSSTTASTTNVAGGERLGVGHDLDVLGIDLRAEPASVFSTLARARSAEVSERASSSTGPWWAAVAARPQAMRAAAGYREAFAHGAPLLSCLARRLARELDGSWLTDQSI